MPMNIFEFAKEREKKMEGLFRELSQETHNVGLKKILTMLADQENLHYKIIESFEKKSSHEKIESDLISEAKSILKTIKQRKSILDLNVSQPDLYIKVRQFEKESEEFYLKCAKDEKDSKLKKIYELFAAEEHKHYVLMDELVQFVSRPEEWVEHAEFSSLRQY
ncbi:MAG: hypothetical protein A2504_09650 [Bdellovibrionales bacterium RIFOXYD12_FULL_39_22]|nr:MAG: hypothetical protein A2385_13140 [Bdellovibrionales bacterium RIFOXYB1_FULL_39_21]OFZ40991.1 MAG: hypothetical protein A2485_16650 [Bdellovibrionales bacterium RIFOXYC12_FULL_39_17]OFZ44819.1 MAG: hypothetical protein A2404_09940 [Bdellovibrionales bacterium RIFOXYC1_FULL_39_130]OFZ74098.1 MAG: hypothetical protein A2451_14590 [Bdellovibrionales bacterium RIFOXYC2_FULL_39_8]OFZ74284.1 MAG: hypothetical protein A2560_16905 [Bdellovibrionales bacterium RIFOXYD1_FULL_39_84]OFZ92148.1 MAG: